MVQPIRFSVAMLVLIIGLILAINRTAGLTAAENWPQWRGPHGDGLSGSGTCRSSGMRTAGSSGRRRCRNGARARRRFGATRFSSRVIRAKGKLLLLRIDKQDGKIVWQQEVGTGDGSPRSAEAADAEVSSAAQSGQPFARDRWQDCRRPLRQRRSGRLRLRWASNCGNGICSRSTAAYTIWWGHANSPVIYRDLVISVCMQDSLADLQSEPVRAISWPTICTPASSAGKCRG